LAPIPGVTLPTPYGGKFRQIMVDLDPGALNAHGISPNDVLNAVNPQGLTLPSGDAKLGDKQFIVRVNAVAPSIEALNHLPIKQVGGATVYLSDVAHVRDAWAVQANVVRAEGKRSVLLTIIKNGDASTLDVVIRRGHDPWLATLKWVSEGSIRIGGESSRASLIAAALPVGTRWPRTRGGARGNVG